MLQQAGTVWRVRGDQQQDARWKGLLLSSARAARMVCLNQRLRLTQMCAVAKRLGHNGSDVGIFLYYAQPGVRTGLCSVDAQRLGSWPEETLWCCCLYCQTEVVNCQGTCCIGCSLCCNIAVYAFGRKTCCSVQSRAQWIVRVCCVVAASFEA